MYPNKRHERTSDPTWIARCGAEGWVAISGDKRLETNVENRNAVITAKCKVFLLTDTNSRAEEWAAAIITGQDKFFALVRKHSDRAFFVNIGKRANSHVMRLRFPEDYCQKKQAPNVEGGMATLAAQAGS